MLRREYIDVTISMARLGGPFFGQKFKVFKEKLRGLYYRLLLGKLFETKSLFVEFDKNYERSTQKKK